ncbi:MAG TPA: zinc ribbon domain-containing protein [Bacilli bacterium]|nr:MAG: Double zinc ribbon [Tenericutes bacterium ADurb.BinA124]HNZ49871.1 zinc ribbon domain-containing protein [Bacilli bacterium]HOH17687.1 zinc ribbon domain-containing protein [Bacilli bacterium]HPX84257.1 zinc ribbon domain-containing protein [Bacilli bacterium]HQC74028.1 zinc ribbon domain-containing protein [Bacilli bacterium]
MYCQHCGNEVKDGDRFCQHCGRPLLGQSQAPEKPKITINKTDKPLVYLTVFALLLTLFPFHNLIVIIGTLVGMGGFLAAALKRNHHNRSLVLALMTLSLTAIIIQLAWFVFINIIL